MCRKWGKLNETVKLIDLVTLKIDIYENEKKQLSSSLEFSRFMGSGSGPG
jgi:hypothetical protein